MRGYGIGSASRACGALLLVLLTGLVVSVPPSMAVRTHEPQTPSVGAGELTRPAGLAVDSAGNLYVADRGAGFLRRYDASGAPDSFGATETNLLGPFTFPEGVSQVAVDDGGSANAGHFYVLSGTQVIAFDAEGRPAPFSASEPYVSGNKITGTSSAPFNEAIAVAVDSDGDIYVSELFETYVFSPRGEYLTAINEYEAGGLAVDSTGVVLYDSGGSLSASKPDVYPPTVGTNYTPESPAVELSVGVAVDRADDDVYVGYRGSVRQLESFTAGNGLVSEFAQAQLAEGAEPTGLAVAGPGGANAGDVYVGFGSEVVRYGPLVTVPDAVTEPATGVDSVAKTATLHGTVDPQGIETAECVFEYGIGNDLSASAPCEESAAAIGSGTGPVPVEAEVTGLAPGTYNFRLHAANGDGGTRGAVQSFTIIAAPIIEAESAETGATEARLRATINPGNSAVTYHFDYGITEAYGSSTQNGTIAAGTAPIEVATGIVGLQPNTTYHFRVVATNGFATVAGTDRTFTTGSATGGGGCPNEALRIGPSAALPECRAYEMVSPPDKNGGAVYTTFNEQGTPDGNGIVFLSTASFAGARANALNSYLARRGGEGWTTTAIDAPQLNRVGLLELTSVANSEDLTKTMQLSLEALTPGAIQGGSNVYLRDNATGALTLIAAETGEFLYDELASSVIPHYLGGTPNWSVFYFSSDFALAPGATSGSANTYEYSGDELKLHEGPVSGEKPVFGPEGSFVLGASKDLSYEYLASPMALSPDATEAPPGATNIYAWHEGTFTLIGQTEAATGEERPGQAMASPDGQTFAFTTFSAMTTEDRPSAACPFTPAIANSVDLHCRDVYVYRRATGKLTCASCNGPGAGQSELGDLGQRQGIGAYQARAVLDDGSVFFDTPNRLAAADSNGVGDVYRWHDGQNVLISTGTSPQVSRFADAGVDGKDVFFTTTQPLVGIDRDQRNDLYDARVDGGFAAQYPAAEAAPCEGDECRQGVKGAPLPAPIGSGAEPAGANLCAALVAGSKHATAKVRRLGRRVKVASGKHRASLQRRLAKERKRARAQSTRANTCRRSAK
jgi:NHL repeat